MGNPIGTPGLWGVTDINGFDVTADIQTIGADLKYSDKATLPQNVGYHQHLAGAMDPAISLDGYRLSGVNKLSAWEMLRKATVGSATDLEYIITNYLGYGASPAVGDIAILSDATLITGPSSGLKPDELMMLPAKFGPRGKRWGIGRLLMDYTGKGTNVGSPVDMGAYGVGVGKGAVAHLQVLTNTGVKAFGTLTCSGVISDGDKFTLNGVDYVFKTAITATINQILIDPGASTQVSMSNLWACLSGATGAGTIYSTGSAKITGTVTVSLPVASVITLTYLTIGTGGNSYTLAKTATNLAVSGATLTTGAAGDTITSGIIQSATSSGGSYTTFCTFTSDGTVQQGERVEVATGTVINRWWKVTMTISASTQTIHLRVAGARLWL